MSTESARARARALFRAVARRVLILAPGVAAASLVLGTLTAPAAHAGPSPGQKIADALRESPVHVDPAYAQAVPPERQRRLVRQIERTGLPLYVVLVPLVEGDPWGGSSRQLTEVVHDRLGSGDGEEAVFITTGDSGGSWLDGREWPGEKHQAREAASAVGFQDEMKGKSLGARVARAIEIVESGDGREQYERATADLGEGSTTASGGGSAPGREESDGQGPGLLSVLLAPAVLALLGGGAYLVLRRRGRAAATPFFSPDAVFASARAADERGLRRRAHDEVVAFGEELSAAEAGDGGAGEESAAALQRALDAYAAAGTVLDAARGLPDLAGVLALVAEGRDALLAARPPRPPAGRLSKRRAAKLAARRQPPLPLCFFHPLHGRAAGRIRWRPLGRRESLRVAACEECAAAVRTHRRPEVLTDRQEGRDVPYFEVSARDSLWAATGYGSLGEETLTERVTRGDFSRSLGS